MPAPTTSPLFAPLLAMLELDALLDDWAIPQPEPANREHGDERTER